MIQLDWVGDLNDLNILSIFVRLLLAMAFGGTIGFERGIRQRAAGLRTHMLLAVGAASTMLVSQYMYASYGVGDPARLSAQVISGIGFLGAGTIIVTRRNQVKGDRLHGACCWCWLLCLCAHHVSNSDFHPSFGQCSGYKVLKDPNEHSHLY